MEIWVKFTEYYPHKPNKKKKKKTTEHNLQYLFLKNIEPDQYSPR